MSINDDTVLRMAALSSALVPICTEPGAHLLPQTRTRTLNDEPRSTFCHWYPAIKGGNVVAGMVSGRKCQTMSGSAQTGSAVE